jgi:hypothetical protein
VSTGKVVFGLTCCELSGDVFCELVGLADGERDTIYSSGYELNSSRFQYAQEGSPTFASDDLRVGFCAYFSRSSGLSRSSVRTSRRLLPRGMCFLVTRTKGSVVLSVRPPFVRLPLFQTSASNDLPWSNCLHSSCCDVTSSALLPERYL